jgi:hypothetical protein
MAKYLRPGFRVLNMGLAVMMAAAAVQGILKLQAAQFDDFLVAVYMM